MSDLDGMLAIDKPAGPTSHDVVLAVRRRLQVKAGHTGTLDPQATGLLLVCLGRATRLSRYLQHQDKAYECIVRLGWATDTYDAEGERVGEPVQPPAFDRDRVEAALEGFRGEIDQIPPVYSAKKVRGQPSYRRVRRGEEVELAPARVRVDRLELVDIGPETIHLRVDCGPGMYVRSLAHDLGRALGCPSHLSELRRTRVGEFRVGDALTYQDLQEAGIETVTAAAVPPAGMFPSWPGVVVTAQGQEVIRNGGVIEPRLVSERLEGSTGETVAGSGPGGHVKVIDAEGALVAVAEVLPGGMLQPRVVMA